MLLLLPETTLSVFSPLGHKVPTVQEVKCNCSSPGSPTRVDCVQGLVCHGFWVRKVFDYNKLTGEWAFAGVGVVLNALVKTSLRGHKVCNLTNRLINGALFLKLQTGNWPKTWRYAKFQVNPRLFYHVRSAPKTSDLPIKMAYGGRFRALPTW